MPPFAVEPRSVARLDVVRRAINERHVLRIGYVREDGEHTERDVRPLALYHWPLRWLLAAWCELRQDFCSFRTDRIEHAALTDRPFVEEPGKTFSDFLRSVASA